MLCMSRKIGEDIIVGDGPNAVTVRVIGIDRGKVRLGFDGPRHIPIDRAEVRQSKHVVAERYAAAEQYARQQDAEASWDEVYARREADVDDDLEEDRKEFAW